MQRKPTSMKDIAHHTHDPVALNLGNRQPAASPDHDMLSQRAKPHPYLLGRKVLFVALGHAQPLLVALERRFDAASTLIIEGDVRKPHC